MRTRRRLLVATFSIVACDLGAGDWGVAVASKFPAVGSVVPWAKAGVGAIATQAWANVTYGPEGLDMLEEGIAADQVIERLTQEDEARDRRQVGVVDAQGKSASFTGPECMEWAGGITGDGYACQGNILTGPEVPQAMADAFEGGQGDLVDRLLVALQAGDAAGGDRRGRQSAALLVVRDRGGYDQRNDRHVDLRVDDHPAPVAELARIFSVFDREFLVRNDPLMPATAALVEEVQRRLRSLGLEVQEVNGRLNDETRNALETFAGQYNLEARLRSDDLLSESLIRDLRDLTPDAR
jgi:uncharacterized Ntn-hydrolase superfamily protein